MDGAFLMVTWNKITDFLDWKEASGMLGASNYLQMWGWGEYRSCFGWEPLRCVARGKGGRPVAMAQILIRRLPGRLAMVWVPGGVMGDTASWAPSFFDGVRELTGIRRLLLRINDLRPSAAADVVQLRANGWARPIRPLTSGLSLLWNIDVPGAERRAALSKNWRHNLKRSEKNGLLVEEWPRPDLDEIAALYREMESLKSLPQQISGAEVEKMMVSLAGNILCFRCVDDAGRLVALRACALENNRAWDLLAAAGESARRLYATYLTLWRLVDECHARGVTTYDLSGIDPLNNKGVWYFKRGTGAVPVEYLGEWEMASSEWLRRGMNIALALRGGRV